MRQQAAYTLSISLRVAIGLDLSRSDGSHKRGQPDCSLKSIILRSSREIWRLVAPIDILKRDQLPGHQREVLSIANDVHAQRNL